MKTASLHPLAEVRAEAEGTKAKEHWTLIAREHIARTLLATGYFSSEDFDALGIPPKHVNVGNSWMGHYSKKGYMEPISWRHSTKPSRKGGKIWIYRITDLGRRMLGGGQSAEVGGGSAAGSTAIGSAAPTYSPHLGARDAQNSTGAPTSKEVGRAMSPPVPSASAEDSPATESHVPVAGESARLFDDSPPSAYDPWERAV